MQGFFRRTSEKRGRPIYINRLDIEAFLRQSAVMSITLYLVPCVLHCVPFTYAFLQTIH
jgi:hypothetical protein